MQIKQINFYPIKSCGGISLKSAIVNPKGIERDRKWMLINDQNKRISQRECEKMTQVHLSQGNNRFIVSSSLVDDLHLPYYSESRGMVVAVIWRDDKTGVYDTCEVQLMDQSYNNWFSSVLDIPCRLVFISELSYRPAQDYNVGLADAYHSHIISQEDVDLLNMKLAESTTGIQTTTRNFRPNFVFEGAPAHTEDEWVGNDVMIGDALFTGRKLCMRCKIPTLDPESGIENKVITATLASYRMKKPPETSKIGIYFGLNLSTNDVGKVVCVGDEIVVVNEELRGKY